MSMSGTFVCDARPSDAAAVGEEEERTTPNVSIAAARFAGDANAGEHVLTASMLDELRRRLREAEEREESGIRARPAPEDAIDPQAALEIGVGDAYTSEALEAALSPLLELERVELEAALAPNSESNFYAGFDDEHPDGVFVATYSRLAIGTPAYVTVHLPAGHRFRTPALVEWVRPPEAAGPDLPAGIGLKMCGLDAETRALVRIFARHRKPIFYVD
jgi:Tfp pilus assembly protein PilZ